MLRRVAPGFWNAGDDLEPVLSPLSPAGVESRSRGVPNEIDAWSPYSNALNAEGDSAADGNAPDASPAGLGGPIAFWRRGAGGAVGSASSLIKSATTVVAKVVSLYEKALSANPNTTSNSTATIRARYLLGIDIGLPFPFMPG
jgi:hypothetical protein